MKLNRLSSKFFTLSIQSLELELENSGSDQIFNCIKSIESGANKISSWSLSVLGGSILTILSGSYLHPENLKMKLLYLLFILGWIFLGVSLFNAKEILGSSIAADLYKGKKNSLLPIFSKCNNLYAKQLKYFNLSLLTFGVWLAIYIFWWVFRENLLIFLNL